MYMKHESMLANPNDFGYSSAPPMQHNSVYEPSGERPRLYAMDPHSGPTGYGYPSQLMTDPQQQQQPSHQQPPSSQPQQPQHHQVLPSHLQQYDHEPLMMNLQNASAHYYAQLPNAPQAMLHVATDYATTQSMPPPQGMNTTPSSTRSLNLSGAKRSREELNLKEKKRMFKLNDRINELKTLLDDAGVQCKKNKQSILDNTFHYISMLRSNLLIAKQKAERAEKQAASALASSNANAETTAPSLDPMAVLLTQCFQQSTMARAIVTSNLEPVAFNAAFVRQCGVREDALLAQIRVYLSEDDAQLDRVVEQALTTHQTSSAKVKARTATGTTAFTLLAAPVAGNGNANANEPTYIEFSLVPVEKEPVEEVATESITPV